VSTTPTLGFWLDMLLVLAAGTAVLVLLAALPARWARGGAGRRTLWQAATLALAGLLLAELTGAGMGAADWLRHRPDTQSERVDSPDASAPSPPAAALPPEAPVVSRPPAGAPPVDPPEATPAASTPAPAVWWPAVLWLPGAVAVIGRVALARGLLLAFRRRHRPVVDDGLMALVSRGAGRVGLRRRVTVLEGNRLVGPVAFGILRPTVAVPAQFGATFTPAQQEVILAHELTHLAAGDPAWHLLAELVTAALWWHPLAWWARYQLHTASELAADEASALVDDGPAELARCLVELGGRLAGAPSAGWVRMAGNGFRSGLGRRVERLVRLDGRAWRPPSRVRGGLILAVAAVALLAAAVVSTAWARARALPEGDEPMRPVWRRSLAGVVLVAALGSGGDAGRTGEPPQAPPTRDGQTIRREPVPGTQTDRYLVEFRDGGTVDEPSRDATADKMQKLRQQLGEAINEYRSLRDQADKVNREKAKVEPLAVPSAPALKKLNDQLEALKAQATELARKRADLEDEIRALEQNATEQTSHIKVFRLKNVDPEETRAVLEALLSRQRDQAGPSGEKRGGGPPSGGTRPGSMMRPSGSAGPPRSGPGGGLDDIGAGGRGGGPGDDPVRSWRLAADRRARCLIARGTEQDLRIIGDLVTLLDVSDGGTVPRFKNYRVFRLRHANANAVAQFVNALDIAALVVPAPQARMVLVSGSESALKELGEVIEAVDVEGKPVPGGKEDLFGKP
jgi:beta-lactamase regulating signal transducer with metallopeptidase domain